MRAEGDLVVKLTIAAVLILMLINLIEASLIVTHLKL